MAYLSYTKDMQGVADVFLRDADLYAPLLQFIEGVMTRPSDLTKAEREMIAAHVSSRNGCDFCVGAHRWTLAAMKVDWQTIDALQHGPDSEDLPSRLRVMLRYAEKLTDAPGQMNQNDSAALTAAGWSEQAIEDAINVVALFNYVNRLVDALGIENDDTYFRRVGQALATSGYKPLLERARQLNLFIQAKGRRT
ncbi:MAG: peroxidase-related enzyme [Pseudomonadota bacterium]